MSELLKYLNAEAPLTLDEKIAKGEKVTVYKLDSKGKQRQWSIKVVVQPMSKVLEYTATIQIETGLVGGKKVLQKIDITEGKNLGKANATTPYTQAVAEAQAKLEQQLRSGYVADIKDLKESGTLGSGIKEPMTAHKYDPNGKQSGSKTLEKMKLVVRDKDGKVVKREKIHVQPKYDGNRRMHVITDTEITPYSRKGDIALPVPQIIEELQWSHKSVGGTSTIDGELYTNELSFNTLNGLLKKETKTAEDWEKIGKVKYYIYDIYSDLGYEERYELLKSYASEHVIVVPSFELDADDDAINEKLEEFLANGDEGLMIRLLGRPYENKRTWQLVKCKVFEDAEFKILDMELNSMGRLGGVIVELPEPTKDRDGKVVTQFKAGLGKGVSHEDGMKIWAKRDESIGKMATVEFFGLSEYKIPRFPKFKAVRED